MSQTTMSLATSSNYNYMGGATPGMAVPPVMPPVTEMVATPAPPAPTT